jgi:hypothetical protein
VRARRGGFAPRGETLERLNRRKAEIAALPIIRQERRNGQDFVVRILEDDLRLDPLAAKRRTLLDSSPRRRDGLSGAGGGMTYFPASESFPLLRS